MYPVVLNVAGRRAVVVGGGPVAERKVRSLLDAGAAVTLVAPDATDALQALAAGGALMWERRPYAPGDAAGAFVVVTATGAATVDATVVADAREHGALVNDAADAARGDFHTPAVHRAGPLTVAVDTGGLSPSFTKRVRDELAVALDARYARAAATLGRLRERVLAVVPEGLRAEVLRRFSERDLDELAALPPGQIEHEVERMADTVAGVVPSAPKTLVCASRASALAMTQTRGIMARLAAAGIASTVHEITTRGDTVQDRPLALIGSDSVFVAELEHALRERRADYAVHSCKDLPSMLADDMTIAAFAGREDPRDVFCSERWPSFDALPAGAVVGTSSPRRRAQLAARRPDLRYDDIRGNVDTRLRKLREGGYDAIVLAAAGLARLGLRATHTVPFGIDVVVPAVAQGVLAVETRAADPLAARLRELLEDPRVALRARAERAFLRTLRGGCQAPVGAHAVLDGDRLVLAAAIAAPDGSTVLRDEASVTAPDAAAAEALGAGLAAAMLAAGGAALLAPRGPLAGRVFLLPRTIDRPSRIAPALRDAGAEVVEVSDSAQARDALDGRIPAVVLFPSSGSVRVVTEYLDTLRDDGYRPVVAAMGPSSSATAGDAGWPPDVVAPDAEVGSFVQTVTRFVLERGA